MQPIPSVTEQTDYMWRLKQTSHESLLIESRLMRAIQQG